jgi:hypothetical protein
MQPTTRAAIEAELRVLVGEPVAYWMRAADMAEIGFGPTETMEGRRGPREVSSFILHVQCAWRIVRDGRVIVGSLDYNFPPIASEIDPIDFEPRNARRNLRDDLEQAFLAHLDGPHLVGSVEGRSTGDIRIVFADGCAFETFVWSAQRVETKDEHWRFFRPNSKTHFVVTAAGIVE